MFSVSKELWHVFTVLGSQLVTLLVAGHHIHEYMDDGNTLNKGTELTVCSRLNLRVACTLQTSLSSEILRSL